MSSATRLPPVSPGNHRHTTSGCCGLFFSAHRATAINQCIILLHANLSILQTLLWRFFGADPSENETLRLRRLCQGNERTAYRPLRSLPRGFIFHHSSMIFPESVAYDAAKAGCKSGAGAPRRAALKSDRVVIVVAMPASTLCAPLVNIKGWSSRQVPVPNFLWSLRDVSKGFASALPTASLVVLVDAAAKAPRAGAYSSTESIILPSVCHVNTRPHRTISSCPLQGHQCCRARCYSMKTEGSLHLRRAARLDHAEPARRYRNVRVPLQSVR